MIPIGEYLTEFTRAGRARPLSSVDEPLMDFGAASNDLFDLEGEDLPFGPAPVDDEDAPSAAGPEADKLPAMTEQTLEALRATHAADLAATLAASRGEWAQTEGSVLAEAIKAGLADLENRIADQVATVLDPLIAKAARIKAVDQARTIVANLLAGTDRPPITISGAADLVEAMRAAYGDQPTVTFEPADGPELTISVGDTRIRSQLRSWARKLDAVLGAEA